MRLTPGDALIEAAFAALDRRLSKDADHPVALALSGGGDSVALLDIAARWAVARGRRLLCLTVDHRLNPYSGRWTALAAEAARRAGADWRGVARTEPLAPGGLPAAARRFRHARLAEAAQAGGARVILTGHTADDLMEAERMRAEGSTVGRPREWSPSPAWPQGRGLMLLRPLLGARRADLRDYLTGRGLDWIEDPANDDPRFARARARRDLAGGPTETPLSPSRPARGPYPDGEDGVFSLRRDAAASALAAALVCAGGGDRTPRGPRLETLITRLRSGETFTAVLAGARIEAGAGPMRIMREPGEFARGRLRPPVREGRDVLIWDGRYALHVPAGWAAAPAAGLMERLSRADRARLKTLPSAARRAAPVLVPPGGDRPRLALGRAGTWSLAEARLGLALGQTTHEDDLIAAMHGADAKRTLFWDETCWAGDRGADRPWTEERNEPA